MLNERQILDISLELDETFQVVVTNNDVVISLTASALQTVDKEGEGVLCIVSYINRIDAKESLARLIYRNAGKRLVADYHDLSTLA